MNQKAVYHVVPHEEGWAVKKNGAERASSLHATKDEAIERGRELARPAAGQLIVHRQDGTIQTEYTYGEDPYPPAG